MDNTYLNVVLVILAIVTILLNMLVMIALGKRWRILKVQDIVLVVLALCDFLQAVIAYPIEIGMDSSDTSSHDETLCIIAGWSLTCLALTAISLLTSLSFIRMISISYPLKTYELLQRQTTSLFFVIPSLIYGFLWGSFPLMGWSNMEKERNQPNGRCSLNLKSKDASTLSYNFCLLTFCYVLPISIMAFNVYKIRKELLKMIRSSTRVTGADSEATKTCINTEKRFSAILFAMIAVFLLAWTPYAITVFYLTSGGIVTPTLYDTSALLGKSSACYNPVIYALMYKEFRVAVRELIGLRTNKVEPSSSKRIEDVEDTGH